ncbi:hypothetical protein BGZ73_004521 [Actinomortierella ambigua]|nr:hypothetical protein BGZ73_004521 [Actinomortierella ambigua]
MKISCLPLSLAAVAALATILSPSHVAALPAPVPSATSQTPRVYNHHRVVRIQIKSESELKTLTDNEDSLKLDYFTHNKNVGGHLDVRIPPGSFAKFEALHIPYTMLIDDLQQVLDQEKNELRQNEVEFQAIKSSHNSLNAKGPSAFAASTWFRGYHSYADHTRWLTSQISSHSGKASSISFGRSFEGRPQAGIKIGSGPNHVVFHGTLHAREWVSTMVVEYIIDQLLTSSDPRVAKYLKKYTFHIVPIANPDGFVVTQTSDRMHRKNTQVNRGCLGTDPNRNWGYKWGAVGASTNPCSDDYMGPSAFSTPEASNIAKYLKSLPNVAVYIDFHAYSQLWMVPYGFTSERPKTYKYMAGLAQAAATALRAVHGTAFRTGDIYHTIYPASGSSVDYAYSIGVKAPFAVELRDTGRFGFSLPANQIVPSGEETWAAFSAILDKA